jgi:hypothetical protein
MTGATYGEVVAPKPRAMRRPDPREQSAAGPNADGQRDVGAHPHLIKAFSHGE